MWKYWKSHPKAKPTTKCTIASSTTFDNEIVLSKFDCLRLSLIEKEEEEGWPTKLCSYLKDMPDNIIKNTDIVEWWQVSLYCEV